MTDDPTRSQPIPQEGKSSDTVSKKVHEAFSSTQDGKVSPVPSLTSSLAHNETEADDIPITPSRKSKKRVQFHSEENLVRIREIPPRSEQPSSDEEDSGSSDDSDDEDDEDDSDDDDDDDALHHKEGDKGTSNAIPVIVNNSVKLDPVVKGSYGVSKTKGKGSHIVASITGVTAPTSNTKPKQKRHVSRDRKPKKVAKNSQEKSDTYKCRHKTVKKKAPKKTEPEKYVPLTKRAKEVRVTKSIHHSTKTTQIKPLVHCLSPTKKSPPKYEPSSPVSASLPSVTESRYPDRHNFRELPVTQVYTMDGFIFPADPTDHLIKGRSVTGSLETGATKSELSKAVIQKKKCFAWQMANGDQTHVLFGTPCILPMWESLNSYKQTAVNGVKTKL